MNPWEWIWDYRMEAQRSGNLDQLRLCQLAFNAFSVGPDFPEERLAKFEAAHDLAIRLKEAWWTLFCEHWVIETLLYGVHRPNVALDRAVRAVLEARKPIYDAFPQRVHLHLNLVGAYLKVDPIGYQDKLREAFNYLEPECEASLELRAYFSQLKGDFLDAIGDPVSIEVAWEYLQRADEVASEHFQWDALYMLAETSYRYNRPLARQNLGEVARLGEEIARREDRTNGVATFIMWQALAARWKGDETGAAQLYRSAMELQAKVPPPRKDIQFAAMAFHCEGSEQEEALRICQSSLRVLRAHKLTFAEAQRRLEKCQLLRDMGRDWSAEARRLRRVGDRLVSKAHWQEQIEALGEKPL
ncbi:hypothetical protein EON80_03890 [bacterium]|nr:MAG: hypothetical protein EON80_03890 [bacterium]